MAESSSHKQDLIGIFANHPVAANLLMILMLLSGMLALSKLNVQFFPTFELDIINVSTTWTGASAEDVETSITTPLEQRLRNVSGIKLMTSSSAQSRSVITLEFEDGTNISQALDQARQEVDDFTNLPTDAEPTRVAVAVRYETVAKILLSGPQDPAELRKLARQVEQQLLDRGVDRVTLNGLPEEIMAVEVQPLALQQLGTDLTTLANQIAEQSQDLPAGTIGQEDGTRELRSLSQARDVAALRDLQVSGSSGNRVDLESVAEISRKGRDFEPILTINGERAVELELARAESGNSVEAARILDGWVQEVLPTLPPNINAQVFNTRWELIQQRIDLLLLNGLGGLLLVLAILFLFLSGRTAFWVSVGIPVSFMATLAVVYLAGGSINMVSLFALIMALGIIVDDAIVVGEDAQAHYETGEDPLRAAEGGARRMFAPVIASSLTTIAAFLPLMIIGGRIGNIFSAIPLVIISVIIASLIESFFILPGHLRHSFAQGSRKQVSGLRQRLDGGFAYFRDKLFRRWVTLAVDYREITLALVIGLLILAIGLVAGGRLKWSFFPSPDSTSVYANARFVAGTPPAKVDEFLKHVESALTEVRQEIDEDVVVTHYVGHGKSSGRSATTSPRVGSLYVELVSTEERSISNKEFIGAWRDKVQKPAGLENFSIAARRTGGGRPDIEVRLTGANIDQLKRASQALEVALGSLPGVSAIDTDLPYGREQLIYRVSPEGEALGLTTQELGRQLRAAYSGRVLQKFQDGADEVELRVMLPDSVRNRLHSLDDLPIRLASGEYAALNSVARWDYRQGFDAIRHASGALAVSVEANVDIAQNSTPEVEAALNNNVMPDLQAEYGIEYSFEGRAEDQRGTLGDLKTGVWLSLALIFIVLAWVFGSWVWPIVVMSAIPLGLTGAITGHWIMGMNLTILSLFGFFALSGIVVNDSIVLITFYKALRAKGVAVREALIEAACQRLRAVLLTSLTTVGGLTPLLFETSRQAQFLIPMVVSIAFGLMYATVLILFFIPAMLSVFERRKNRSNASNHSLLFEGESIKNA